MLHRRFRARSPCSPGRAPPIARGVTPRPLRATSSLRPSFTGRARGRRCEHDDPLARSVHGTVPKLVEKITRQKIYDMTFWKERCFGVSAEALVDLATELRSFGGIYGGNAKATDFLCLTLKMLQIQPDHEIVLEFVRNEDYKYVRLLGALYLRLVGKPVEVYQYLEPLLNDYRKVRHHTPTGAFTLTHVDEFVWDLSKDQCCDIALPAFPTALLENTGS